MNPEVHVIGGGLAGSEAAFQIARQGIRTVLHEMRPGKTTPAHTTDRLGELVCSNSLKSEQEATAPFLLKQELRRMGSLLLRVAEETKVPAGHALAVDRDRFSRMVSEEIQKIPLVDIVREEVCRIPDSGITVIATGPLTSPKLSEDIVRFAGSRNLYFYDAVAPIVEAATLDRSKLFAASRYGKGGEDYLNAPMSREEYVRFFEALVGAETVPLKDFDRPVFFEGCLPIEELARRGVDTLRFGPMKPVGLVDPATGRRPHAAVQLRLENRMADCYNLVGFQNHLKYADQRRVFRMIPGLENAEFTRYGQIHRNSYIHAPRVLYPTLQTRLRPELFFAGQICGVEGYVESMAMGLLAGINAGRLALSKQLVCPPDRTACGSLVRYITGDGLENFQPANITFGLIGADEKLKNRVRDKKERRRIQVQRALRMMDAWMQSIENGA
jgi:methylenetetrahydrofolate--tRNA-(uracil-5-)-methyltransferase